MMTRRLWLYTPLFALLASSCASVSGAQAFSLSKILQALPSIVTSTAFVEKFGEPQNRINFNRNESNDQSVVDGYSILEWKKARTFAMPADLLDRLPIKATILTYHFRFGSSPDWSGGLLYIYVNEDDRIVGWMCDRGLHRSANDAFAG